MKDKEHRYTDDGEEFCCPVCGTAGLTDTEGDVAFDSCEHLRFSLHSDCGEDLEFFNDWDIEGFLAVVENDREKDEYAEVLDILSKIQHLDVDKAMIYIWQEDPLNHPWMIGGYKREGE